MRLGDLRGGRPRFALRPIGVARFSPSGVSVSDGLAVGEIVVTAGVQALRPGQEVRLIGAGA